MGNTKWGFTGNFSVASPLHVELAALKFGFKTLMECNLPRVLIDTDSTQAVHFLQRPQKDGILDCQAFLVELWNSPVLYTFCVCNRAAYAMAHLGVNYEQPCCV